MNIKTTVKFVSSVNMRKKISFLIYGTASETWQYWHCLNSYLTKRIKLIYLTYRTYINM